MSKGERGFSLTELLVAMGMAVIVGMTSYVVFQSSNRSSQIQGDVSDAQQNVRVAMEELAKGVRSAGFGLPNPPFSITITPTTGAAATYTSAVTISNASTAPDGLLILGGGFRAGTLAGPGQSMNGVDPTCNASGGTFVCVTAGDRTNFFDAGGVFIKPRTAINLEGGHFVELAAAGHDYVNGKLRLAAGSLDRDYAASTTVYIIEAYRYDINPAASGCTASAPCLYLTDITGLRGGSGILANNVEDLQLAFGVDVNPRDGRVDDANADGAYTAADYASSPADPASVIAVRANVVGRTQNTDRNGQTFRRICLEDRTADATCTGAAADGFRRRVLTKIITIRNPKAA
ncbi:MAG: PilW family protein [Nitrospirae bacterium]|nr:PilW family protein [Nitrospirota bacterium]